MRCLTCGKPNPSLGDYCDYGCEKLSHNRSLPRFGASWIAWIHQQDCDLLAMSGVHVEPHRLIINTDGGTAYVYDEQLMGQGRNGVRNSVTKYQTKYLETCQTGSSSGLRLRGGIQSTGSDA